MAQLVDLPPDEYFEVGAFSASLAKELISHTPAHAHALQLKERTKDPTDEMDMGTVVHRLVLGVGKRFSVLHFENWRTKDARAARDEARASGLVPILVDTFERAKKTADAILASLHWANRRDAQIPAALDGVSEQAMLWDEETPTGLLPCKGMMDHVWVDRGLILDLKIVTDASPTAIERQAEYLKHSIQHAAYTSGLAKVCPDLAGRIRFLFLFAEPSPPFAINLVEPDGLFRSIGDRRWSRACATWSRCLKANDYPGFAQGINTLTVSPWAVSQEAMIEAILGAEDQQ